MTKLDAATFQIIKDSLRINYSGGDTERYHLPIHEPEPTIPPNYPQHLIKRISNRNGRLDWKDRWDTSQEYFKAAREATTIDEALGVLKRLVLYLENYARKPFFQSGFDKKEDGTLAYWSTGGRNPFQDKFFEDQVISVARDAITELEKLLPLVQPGPPTGKTTFIDRLQNGFTEVDLKELLRAVNFIDDEGKTTNFKGGLIHDVLDALELNKYLDASNREIVQKELQQYLELKQTRIQRIAVKGSESVRSKALAYLSEWKNQRKTNR